ncbi:ceroid-lipofuscinosis neuronal protein 6 [Sarotherodon galilaeus]
MNFSFITALSLCSFWGISISAFGFQTTKVQPGEDVTLQCTNNSKMDSMTFWFRLVNSTTVRYISRLVNSKREATYSDGFRNRKFEMRTNIIALFLKIKKVDQSDSGLYFCGFHSDGRLLFSVTRLNVGEEPDVVAKVTSFTIGVLSVLLLMVIIGLVVQNRKLQQAFKEQQNLDQSESRDNDDLNYATVTFQPKAKRIQMGSNVIYAATR